MTEWIAWLREEWSAKKEEKGIQLADSWARNFVHAMEKGVVTLVDSKYKETEEEAAARIGPTLPAREHAFLVFQRLAGMAKKSGKKVPLMATVTKANFVAAFRLDTGVTRPLDTRMINTDTHPQTS